MEILPTKKLNEMTKEELIETLEEKVKHINWLENAIIRYDEKVIELTNKLKNDKLK